GDDVLKLSWLAVVSAGLAAACLFGWALRELRLGWEPVGVRRFAATLLLLTLALGAVRSLAPQWLYAPLPWALAACWGLALAARRRWAGGLAAVACVLAAAWVSGPASPERFLTGVLREPFWLEMGVWKSMALMGLLGGAFGALVGLAVWALK